MAEEIQEFILEKLKDCNAVAMNAITFYLEYKCVMEHVNGGVGLIAINDKGKTLGTAQIEVRGVRDAITIEIIAALLAMDFASQMGFHKSNIEGDASIVVTKVLINKVKDLSFQDCTTLSGY
ncbi:hypothetical protein DITRI_Ditri02bG0105400 [Diplodiscus trichospermus]